jgi:hypothetical protein
MSLVSGVAMLRGQDWARWLYALWGPLNLLLGMFGSQMMLEIVPGTFIYFVCLFFLFRQPASAFFGWKRRSVSRPDDEGSRSERT